MRTLAFSSLLLTILLSGAGCSKRGQNNYERCLKLRVDMTKAQMIQIMGEPEETIPFMEGKSLDHLRGRIAYEWSNPSTMPGPDHVSLFEASGKIASIRCSDTDVTAPVWAQETARP